MHKSSFSLDRRTNSWTSARRKAASKARAKWWADRKRRAKAREFVDRTFVPSVGDFDAGTTPKKSLRTELAELRAELNALRADIGY